MKRVRTTIIAVLCSAIAGVAMASWYDDYDAGLAALNKGQWQAVIQKMTAAIGGQPKDLFAHICPRLHPQRKPLPFILTVGNHFSHT